jgi:hypothetical protein
MLKGDRFGREGGVGRDANMDGPQRYWEQENYRFRCIQFIPTLLHHVLSFLGGVEKKRSAQCSASLVWLRFTKV